MAKIGSWVTQGVSMEMVFDLNKDIKAKDIYDTLMYMLGKKGVRVSTI